MRRRTLLLSFIALAAPAAAQAAGKTTPETFIRDFYSRERLPVKRSALRAMFAADLAAAMSKEYGKDEPGELNFDYRYGTQDYELKNLVLDTTPAAAGGTQVRARFDSFGKPFEIRYRLAPQGSGWRILDVSAPAQNDDRPWSLREKLGLSPAP
jgi:hypothetical protein